MLLCTRCVSVCLCVGECERTEAETDRDSAYIKRAGKNIFYSNTLRASLCLLKHRRRRHVVCMLIDLWAKRYSISPKNCRGAEKPICVFRKTVQLHEQPEPKETWRRSVQLLIRALMSCCCLVSHAWRCWHQALAGLCVKASSSVCVDKFGSALSPHWSQLWNRLCVFSNVQWISVTKLSDPDL